MATVRVTIPFTSVLHRPRLVSPQRSLDPWIRALMGVIFVTWMISFPFDYYLSLTILNNVALIATLAGLFYPNLGLVGIGMLTALDPLTRPLLTSGGLLRYNTFNYLLLLAMLVGFPLLQKLRDTQTRALQALVAAIALGLFVTNDRAAGVQHVLNLVSAIGLSFYFLRARFNPRALYNFASVTALTAAVGGIVFFAQIDRLPWKEDDAEGRYMNANAFAYFPLAGLFAVCLAYPFVPPKHQTRLGILGLLTLLPVFLSGSRGAIILGFIILLYLLYATKGVSRRLLFVTSVPLLAATAISLFPSLQEYAVNRFLKLVDPRFSMASRTSGRSDIAIVGASILAAHPLGVGTGGFSSAYAEADADEMAFAGIAKQAHSAWVKTAVENGILGLAALTAYVLSFTFTGWHRRNSALFRLGLLVSACLAIAFFGSEFQNKALWMLAAGAGAILNYPFASASGNYPAGSRRTW